MFMDVLLGMEWFTDGFGYSQVYFIEHNKDIRLLAITKKNPEGVKIFSGSVFVRQNFVFKSQKHSTRVVKERKKRKKKKDVK